MESDTRKLSASAGDGGSVSVMHFHMTCRSPQNFGTIDDSALVSMGTPTGSFSSGTYAS